jgi:hypothetical protein
MTKKDLVKSLDSGVIKCKIDDAVRQFTRDPELVGIDVTKAAIKGLDKGAAIGVYELGIGEFTTITNADMTDIISNSSDA